MAVILLYDLRPTFKEKLYAVIKSGQDFLIRTQFGSDDTLPALLLQLLYRKFKCEGLEDYDLRSWISEGGRITIKGTYEGETV